MRGRIVYDLLRRAPAKATPPISVRSREIDTGDGKGCLSDLRSSSWEQGDGKTLPLQGRVAHQRAARDDCRGQRAERDDKAVTVKLTKPQAKTLDPRRRRGVPDRADQAHHRGRASRQVAASSWRSTTAPTTGEKRLFDTLTVIGQPVPGDRKATAIRRAAMPALRLGDALAGDGELLRPRQGQRR